MNLPARRFAFDLEALRLARLARERNRSLALNVLTPLQRKIFDCLERGPLYRVSASSGFQAKGTQRFPEQSVRTLVNFGLAKFDPDLGPCGGCVLSERAGEAASNSEEQQPCA